MKLNELKVSFLYVIVIYLRTLYIGRRIEMCTYRVGLWNILRFNGSFLIKGMYIAEG